MTMTHRYLAPLACLVLATAAGAAFTGDAPVQQQTSVPTTTELRTMTARFAPADIGADISRLPAGERQALARLVEAARLMDSLFLRQVWAGNDALLQQLGRDVVSRPPGPERTAAEARLHYFLINKGPWSRLDHNRSFVPGVPAKPEAANFYPAGAAKDEVQKWLDGLSGDAKASAAGFFTTIRRGPQGFTAVPYSIEYQGELAQAATLLREAAGLTSEPTLKKFLTTRADAFVSNDYYASDVAWMELDAAVEPTIGPYEVYEDEWFNAKAAFEAFITVRDEAESKKLQAFSAHLQELENALPIDPKYRNAALGALAPIRVVNVVFAAGDGNRGVQTAAYNLPNDERVVREKGTKRVMLKNMQDAKFRMVLLPIAKVALPAAAAEGRLVRCLLHPHPDARADARARAAQHHRRRARDHGAAGAEGHLQRHRRGEGRRLRAVGAAAAGRPEADRPGHRPDDVHRPSWPRRSDRSASASTKRTAAASRSSSTPSSMPARSRCCPDGSFTVDTAKIAAAVTALTREIMTLQAEGSYAKAKAMIDRLGVVRPEVQKLLDRLSAVPVDIEPKFTTAVALAR